MARFVLNRMLAVLLLIVAFLPSAVGLGQAADKLLIEGPELENCLVTVRYFKARQIAKVVALKLSLLKGGIEEPVEGGFDGLEVFLQSRAVPVKISIMSGTDEVASGRLDEPGETSLKIGKISTVEYTPEEIAPTDEDKKVLEAYVACYNEQTTTQSLVAASSQTTIDAPCLDVFNRELRHRIGSVDLSKTIESFVAWEGDSGARLIAGVLTGESGYCGVRLSYIEGKLIDLQPNCPQLVDDYFREPFVTESYVKQAEKMIRLLFASEATNAHQLYAPQFQQQIKVEQVTKLSESLREKYGDKIRGIELKKSQLMDYNFSQKSRLLNVDLVLTMESDARCIGRVLFNIPCDRNRVGKGLLAGVNVNQVFQSAHPQIAKTTQVLIEQLNKPLNADSLLKIVHPELKAIYDKGRLQALLNRVGTQLKDQTPVFDLDQWSVTQTQDILLAAGAVKFGEKECYIELHVAGQNQLLGFSFYGPAVAESTLGLLEFPKAVGDTAKTFWTHLLNADAESAHVMLDADFQSQFPLEEMKKQLAEPETRPSKLKSIQVDNVRVSSDVSRPIALMSTVYLTAEFEDGEAQQVACDVSIPPADGKSVVYDFSNEFEADFPVASIPAANSTSDGAELAIEAFRSKSPQMLLKLIEPSRREIIDQATLKAYFENFAAIAGKELDAPVSTARTVEYQLNGKRYRCNLFFKTSANEELPIEVWFRDGYLERFVVSHSKINDFAQRLTDKDGIKRRVEQFVEAWFRDVNDSRSFMVSALHSEGTLGALSTMKAEFEDKNGKLTKASIIKESPGEGAGEIEYVLSLEGATGSREVNVLVDVGAFGGMVSAVGYKQ